MYTFVQQRGGGSRRDPNHKSMYKCAYIYVHLSLSPPVWSPFLDYTIKKTAKIKEKIRKIIFGSDLSETNEPTFKLHQKMTKSRKNIKKVIIGSDWSETNNEPTFISYQKMTKS